VSELNLPEPGTTPGTKFVGVYARPGRLTGRVVFGSIVMVLGVMWTLDNLGLVNSGQILRWWPAVLVIAGLWRLLGVGGVPRRVSGAVLTLVGTLLLADRLRLFDFDLWDLWPLALIVIGFGLVTRHWWARDGGAAAPPGDDSGDAIEAFALWSGVDRKPSSQMFRGGDITAIMGGVVVDLRSSTPVEGGAVLELFLWMAGVEIYLPKDWRVINEGTAIMGGFEDSREAPPADATKTLRVRGFVLMGGVEIKN